MATSAHTVMTSNFHHLLGRYPPKFHHVPGRYPHNSPTSTLQSRMGSGLGYWLRELELSWM
jgi:hypothetical protein